MNSIDSDQIISDMQAVWTNWKPTDHERGIWLSVFRRYDFDVGKKAIKEAAMATDYYKPPRKSIFDLLNRYQPKAQQDRTGPKDQPEPTVFVMYEGDGDITLQPGYFFPIITRFGVDEMRAAEAERIRRIENYGGMWKVYQGTSHAEMIKIRHEMRAETVNAA
jgi:hypothetical protein